MKKSNSVFIVLILVVFTAFLAIACTPEPKVNTYTIIYNGNGASGIVPPMQTKGAGEGVTISDATSLIKEGFFFTGWNTAANGNGKNYVAGSFYSADADLTLFATWKRYPYLILQPNGGSGEMDEYWTTGESFYPPVSQFVPPEGFSFLEWNQNSDGSGKSYEYDDVISLGEGQSLRLNAIWVESSNFEFSLNTDDSYTITSVVPNSVRIVVIPSVNNGKPVTGIASRAFSDLDNICVYIPDSISEIDGYAFEKCDNLSVHFWGNNSMALGYNVFDKCQSLSITMRPTSLSNSPNAFVGCVDFSIELKTGLTSIPNNAFSGYTQLSEVSIPEGIVTIGDSAFRNCVGLTEIVLPATTTQILNWAFAGCKKLARVEIPNKCTLGNINTYYIEGAVFSDCIKLSSIVAPNGLSVGGYQSFYNCKELTGISIDSLYCNSWSQGTFEGCEKLKSVTIRRWILTDSHGDMPAYCFKGCIELEEFPSVEGVSQLGLSAFDGCSSLEMVNIPQGVTVLASSVFRNCTKLKSVILPRGLESISSQAFQNCVALTEITIPETVKDLRTDPFSVSFLDGCSKLSDIFLTRWFPQASQNKATLINSFTFSNTFVSTVHVPKGAMADYQEMIPSTIAVVETDE